MARKPVGVDYAQGPVSAGWLSTGIREKAKGMTVSGWLKVQATEQFTSPLAAAGNPRNDLQTAKTQVMCQAQVAQQRPPATCFDHNIPPEPF